MNKSISLKQLRYSVAGFIFASSLLTGNLYYFARQDSWLCVILALVPGLGIVWIYGTLAKKYPGQDLVQISQAVFGKIPGKAVAALYLFYFLSLSFFNTQDLGHFVGEAMLPSTPAVLVYIMFIITCAWAIRKGPPNMTRYALLLVAAAFALILLNAVLLVNKFDFKRLLPALTMPVADYLLGVHGVTMLPYCEIFAFMMFTPYLSKPEKIGRALRDGLLIGAGLLMFIVLRDIVVLGELTAVITQPTFATIQMIDIGGILTRLEVIYANILMILFFLKVSVVYYAAVSCVRGIFGTAAYEPYIHIIGALIVIYAGASFPAVHEHVRWNRTAAATYSTFFLFVIPALTLLVAAARGGKRNSQLKPEV